MILDPRLRGGDIIRITCQSGLIHPYLSLPADQQMPRIMSWTKFGLA